MTIWSFTVPGVPSHKERVRLDRKNVRLYTPGDTVKAERRVRQAFMLAFPRFQPLTGPVLVRFTAIFPITPGWPKYLRDAAQEGKVFHIATPDKDQIEKLIWDALSKDPKSGLPVAWHNDCQCMGGGMKRYGDPPRVEISIEALDAIDVPATPGQARREAQVNLSRIAAREGRLAKSTKSKSGKAPTPLELAISRAVARDDDSRAPGGPGGG